MKRFALLLALTLSACGLREPLRPAAGQQMPPAPAMAAPPPIGRPGRVDELLRRSEEREDDRFDLPPGDIPVDGNGANASQDAPDR